MASKQHATRRSFLKTAVAGVFTAGTASADRLTRANGPDVNSEWRVPLKIGIRAASLKMVGDLDVIPTVPAMPDVDGVELQATSGASNLRDWDVVREYKRLADRWNVRIPSLAGVWDRGVKIHCPAAAQSLEQSIRAAELLGARVILAAFFRDDAPDMSREESYGPVVEMLRGIASRAADAGVVIGLENSLSPQDNRKLVDLVERSAVGVYYDPYNMAYYGHGEFAIPGVKLLGKQRICAVYVKNGDLLLEQPGPIDWRAALAALNEIQYDGWFVFETRHTSTAECLRDTVKNSRFLQQYARMPRAPITPLPMRPAKMPAGHGGRPSRSVG